MRALIFKIFLLYHQNFPIQRGKGVVARVLTRIFGTLTGQNKHGLRLEIFPTSMMDLSYFEESNPSHNITIDEIEKLNEGDVFVDIGANIGYLSLLASQRVGASGKVISFEPSSREYKRLLNNIEINHANNIITYHLALGDTTGQISLIVSPMHTGLNKINTECTQDFRTTIPIFRFDELYKLEKEIALMKIDVEGAEFQVLNGLQSLLKKRLIKNFVIEITPKSLEEFGSSKQQLYSLMEEHGYMSTFNSIEWQYDEVFKRKD